MLDSFGTQMGVIILRSMVVVVPVDESKIKAGDFSVFAKNGQVCIVGSIL
jgi:hypothetical protein